MGEWTALLYNRIPINKCGMNDGHKTSPLEQQSMY